MNVSLTDELERFIENEVGRGAYRSNSEVVRDALRLLVERRRSVDAQLDRLRGAVAEGLEQARQGGLLDGEEVFDTLLRRSGSTTAIE